MIYKVEAEAGLRINGRYFPKNYTVTADSPAEAFARYEGGLLRRTRRIINHVKAVLLALKASNKISIEE